MPEPTSRSSKSRRFLESETGAGILLLLLCLVCRSGQARDPQAPAQPMAQVAGGSFVPLYGNRQKPVEVGPFALDVFPVTNGDFLRFVQEHSRWSRDQVPPLFADEAYLHHWASPLEPGDAAPRHAPVTNVSWFAAKAYCASMDKRLPTLHEWELAARASEEDEDASGQPEFARRILAWYSAPTRLPLPEVGHTFENSWGVWDMHGLVWEWVLDFNSVMMTGASRKDSSGLDRQLFCAAGSVGSVNPNDYAAFMRYAMRSSVRARDSVKSLGFRCARDADRKERPNAP